MNGDKEPCDLIISLGGNCSAAHNLRYREMRFFSLPFDWVYITDTQPITYLSTAFQTHFRDFFLKENLIRVQGNAHHAIIYQDTLSKYYFPNHFSTSIDMGNEYARVATKINRRIDRLYDKIEAANVVLLILATYFPFDTVCVSRLAKTLHDLWPQKTFRFKVLQFNAGEDSETTEDNIVITKHRRMMNDYDFNKTNYEWAFLDKLALPHVPRQKKVKTSIVVELNIFLNGNVKSA